MKNREAIFAAKKYISKNDARLLLMHTLNVDAAKLISVYSEEMSEKEEQKFFSYVLRRASGEPLAYITGHRGFYGLEFIVTPDVLIPREDTEILVECALDKLPGKEHVKVLDLCTGSGCIGLTIAHERKNTDVTLCDVSEAALNVAKTNAQALEINASFILGDVRKIDVGENVYNIIVSNPPYIKESVIESLDREVREYEPYIALWGGKDGLLFYRVIAERFFSAIVPGGTLLFEVGDEKDGKDFCREIKNILYNYGYSDIEVFPDLSGNMRVVSGKRK